MRHVKVKTASSIFIINMSRWRRTLIMLYILDIISSSTVMCGQGLVVGPDVVPHWLTDNHCQYFLVHDLLKLLKIYHWLSEHNCGM
jgi:hypothetical protein